ncbi:hypothetical protein LJR143_003163 [Pseudoxanthomonas sp. LjRoot143]|uniref:hypothetical protein n=1 Tax=Pseudoxanthomonas sp. LjRoot143 TaxID=3342266 RepID=UPI003ECFAB7D
MNTKRHRVVRGVHAFQRMAHLLNDRAVECAENEGWPIQADADDTPRAIARSGVLQRVAVLLRQHVRKEWHFWSGRRDSNRRIKVRPTIPLAALGTMP